MTPSANTGTENQAAPYSAASGGTAHIDNDEIAFKALVKQWHDETGLYSSITKKLKHPAYQKIISMGDKAIPWILQELRDRPSYWFLALSEITKQQPLPPEKLADFGATREAWLAWGQEKGVS